MLKRKFVKQEEAGGNNEGGAAGATKVDLNSAEIQAAINAAAEKAKQEAIAGLKAKNAELLDDLKKRTIPPEELKQWEEMKKRIAADEETRLMSEGKIDEVVAKRVAAMKRETEAQLKANADKIAEYQQLISARDEKLKTLMIDGQLKEAYINLDYEPTAMDDIIRLGRTVFVMDENGKVVPRDETGTTIYGKDGTTPLSAAEWLTRLTEKKPYLKRASMGAGAQQNRGGSKGFNAATATAQEKIAEGLRQLGKH